MALRASITVALPLEMNADLEACSHLLNMPVSAIVRTLVQAHLEKDPLMQNAAKFRETYNPGHEYKPRSGG
jgi:hypothetical protein